MDGWISYKKQGLLKVAREQSKLIDSKLKEVREIIEKNNNGNKN